MDASGLPPAVASSTERQAEVRLGAASTTVPISDLERILTTLRYRVRSCYRAGLASGPAMRGTLTVAFQVDVMGNVATAEVVSNLGISEAVASCIIGVVKKAVFAAPGGVGATVKVPFELLVNAP
jgi:hypothetical protein